MSQGDSSLEKEGSSFFHEIFPSETVSDEDKERLDRTDHDPETGLSMYHAKILGDTYTPDDVRRLWKGVIADRHDTIVGTFYPRHDEVTFTSPSDEESTPCEWVSLTPQPVRQIVDVLRDATQNPDAYTIQKSIEGTILKVFCYEGKWYLSTTKKLDAFKSRWSSKYSFGEMFVYTLRHLLFDSLSSHEDLLQSFFSSLDSSLQYVFMIRLNNDNRIVCRVQGLEPHERIIFLGVYRSPREKICMAMGADDVWKDHPILGKMSRHNVIPSSDIVDSDDNIEARVVSYIVGHVKPDEHQGLFLTRNDTGYNIKILHPTYHSLFEIRGNQPNLMIRYLQLRHDRERLHIFCRLYDKSMKLFHQIENILHDIAKKITYWYEERYVNNKFVSVPYPEYTLMKKCHQWYLEDTTNRRIYVRVVMDFLNREDPFFLYKLIQRVRRYGHQSPYHHVNVQTQNHPRVIKKWHHHTKEETTTTDTSVSDPIPDTSYRSVLIHGKKKTESPELTEDITTTDGTQERPTENP